MKTNKDIFEVRMDTPDAQWRKMQVMNIIAAEHAKENARRQPDLEHKRMKLAASTSALIGALSILP